MPKISLGTCCGSDPKVGLTPWLTACGSDVCGIDTAVREVRPLRREMCTAPINSARVTCPQTLIDGVWPCGVSQVGCDTICGTDMWHCSSITTTRRTSARSWRRLIHHAPPSLLRPRFYYTRAVHLSFSVSPLCFRSFGKLGNPCGVRLDNNRD